MVFDEFVFIQKILASILVGYLLGSIPFAYVAGRFRGIDIFATGSRTAGTANVFWNIGRRTGTVVFVGDVAKGTAAVVIANLLDVTGPLALLAGVAAVMGHWKSVFSRFRGGDGMATLMGVTLALTPALAILGIVAGQAMILLLWRSAFRSAGGIFVCFTVLLGLSQYYDIDRGLVLGLVALAAVVLLRTLVTRRRRARVPAAEMPMNLALDQESDLGQAAPENT